MGPQDIAIWLRYLQRGGAVNAPFLYDLRVGDGLKMPPGSSQIAINSAQALTTKRIDVIWMKDQRTIICEVKKRAGSTALGQLILYRNLFVQTFPEQPQPKMVLVTDELQPDVLDTLIANDIEVIIVGL